MGKQKRNKQRTQIEITAALFYNRENKDLVRGMVINELIDLWLLWKSYEWDKEALQEFHNLRAKWVSYYHFGKMSREDISGMIDALRDEIGIDLTEITLLTPEMIEEDGEETHT